MTWHGKEWYEKLDAVTLDIHEALEQYNDPCHNSYHVTTALKVALKNAAELRQSLDAFFTGTGLRRAVCPKCAAWVACEHGVAHGEPCSKCFANTAGASRSKTLVSGGD